MAWCVVDYKGLDTFSKKRIKKEFELWKSIKNTNHLIKLHDTWFEKGNVIFITELMDCGSIKQFLKSHGLQRKGTIKKWAKQILLGIKALHDSGIAHRDIKSENI